LVEYGNSRKIAGKTQKTSQTLLLATKVYSYKKEGEKGTKIYPSCDHAWSLKSCDQNSVGIMSLWCQICDREFGRSTSRKKTCLLQPTEMRLSVL
jgi:hypothetical protein